MQKIIFLSIFTLQSIFNLTAQSKDETSIRNILAQQTSSWNNGQIESFMNGYQQSDSLMFIGKSGITYGWQNTLSNYKKHYPDTTSMGKLNFELLQVKRLSASYYFIVGKWFLVRSIGNINGAFTLLFRKIKGRWFIVADHSS